MRWSLPLLAFASAARAAAPHSGEIATRSMPEISDFALFGVAVLGVWFVRRALRARFRKSQATAPKD